MDYPSRSRCRRNRCPGCPPVSRMSSPPSPSPSCWPVGRLRPHRETEGPCRELGPRLRPTPRNLSPISPINAVPPARSQVRGRTWRYVLVRHTHTHTHTHTKTFAWESGEFHTVRWDEGRFLPAYIISLIIVSLSLVLSHLSPDNVDHQSGRRGEYRRRNLIVR
jgi:hypothetical protein